MNGILQNAFEAKDRFISELQAELLEKKAINAELLDALKATQSALKTAWDNGTLPASVIPAQIAQNNSAAIAKAEGKQ